MRSTIYLLLLLLTVSCNTNRFYKYSDDLFDASKTKYKIGDDRTWLQKDFDDSNWKYEWDKPIGKSIFYARKTFNIKQTTDSLEPLGIIVQSFGAYEAYWDGVLIGINGSPGKEVKGEKKSNSRKAFLIPKELTNQGKHVLTLRSSQFFQNVDQRITYAYIGEYYTIVRKELITTLFINILAGAFLIAAIYYFFLFISDRKNKAMLIFGLTSFFFFLLIIAEYIKFYVPIHYTDFYLRLKIIGSLTFLVAFLIPYYFALQFELKNKNYFTIAYFILLLITVWYNFNRYDTSALRLGQLMWFSSFAIILYALYQKKKGAFTILIGLILSFIVYQLSIYDISLFVSFAIILLCMFYILSVRTKAQRLAYENSLVQSSRLKIELLKKNIQPHFLMNTLTSLIDWVEEAPDKGVLFIEALAEEFDLLNQVEDQTLIPISQEIKLCKSHINIMKFRKEIDYKWIDEGVSDVEFQKIPPAVIHTLLENGITHCLPTEDNKMIFKLSISNVDSNLCYTFETFASIRNPKKKSKDGTGFKYIKARLTESYGENWKFTSEQTIYGWKNTITILT